MCSTAQVLLILPRHRFGWSRAEPAPLHRSVRSMSGSSASVHAAVFAPVVRFISRTHGESVACRHTDADTPRHVHISPGTHFSWKVHTSVLGSICCTASPGRVIEAPSPDPEKRNNSGSCQVRSAAFRDEGTKSRRCPAHCSSYVV